ncbi:hypothetical protein CCR75_007651 [Bremia lactucae]|uniref:Uncharacterized protein n=1 Tax=Bremia lactucae TaxID=4779 RepID=A0A976IKN7_BRELC|nr:hypothetical protein CCR75_007651 [Bremia lactucae]
MGINRTVTTISPLFTLREHRNRESIEEHWATVHARLPTSPLVVPANHPWEVHGVQCFPSPTEIATSTKTACASLEFADKPTYRSHDAYLKLVMSPASTSAYAASPGPSQTRSLSP